METKRRVSRLDRVPGNSWLEKEISRKTPHTNWCRSKKRSNTGLNSTNNQYWNCNMHFHYTRMQCRSEVVLFTAKCVCLKPHFSDLTKLVIQSRTHAYLIHLVEVCTVCGDYYHRYLLPASQLRTSQTNHGRALLTYLLKVTDRDHCQTVQKVAYTTSC